VKIRFYAHASFRLEADELAVITDPYTPGPQNSGFNPIDEPADIVISMSRSGAPVCQNAPPISRTWRPAWWGENRPTGLAVWLR
jgi:hypothetical protein